MACFTSQISAGPRIEHPKSVLRIGQELDLKVLKIDSERNRISLGLKQTERRQMGKVDFKLWCWVLLLKQKCLLLWIMGLLCPSMKRV